MNESGSDPKAGFHRENQGMWTERAQHMYLYTSKCVSITNIPLGVCVRDNNNNLLTNTEKDGRRG